MARIPRELTPEERAQLEKNNKRQISVASVVLWALCAVIFGMTVGFDVANGNPLLKIALHAVGALLACAASVRHFIAWRKMKAVDAAASDVAEPESAPADADSADTP